MPQSRNPLHRQFTRFLLLPITVAFVLAAVGTMLIGYQSERQTLRTQRQEIVSIYMQSLVRPLWDCDAVTATSIVETLAHLPEVAAVRLVDVCAGTDRIVGEQPASTAPTDAYLHTVAYRDEHGRQFDVGYLTAYFHPLSLMHAISGMLWRYLAVFIVTLVVMLTGATLAFRHIVGRPLQRFKAAIDAHNGGEALGGLELRERNDELGDVMHAYDGLMDELHLRFRRQEALAECARRLLRHSTDDKGPLAGVLDVLMPAVLGDRIFIVENDQDEQGNLVMSRIQEARAPGLMAPPINAFASTIAYRQGYSRWQALFSARQPLLGTLDEFPEDEQQLLRKHGTLSLAAFPIWGQTHWYGYIALTDMHRQRPWSPSEQMFLQTAADMIGAFLENGSYTRQLAAARDQLLDNERALMRTARRDPLTGLGNRIALEEELLRAVARARRLGRGGLVLLIDLDDFKPINDTYGHNVGDEVLRAVAQRLRNSVRLTDTVARLGGDEFVLIIEDGSVMPDPQALVDKLRAAIVQPIPDQGRAVAVGASIGVARYPDQGTALKPLLTHADLAMYDAKRRHKSKRASGEPPIATPDTPQ